MSFRGLALDRHSYAWLTDGDPGVERRLISSSMGRLDDSWESLCRTTLSVACVTVAAAAPGDRDLARSLVMAMAGMMSRMCDFWADSVGGVTQGLPEDRELRAESDATDAIGQDLGGKADGLLGAIMISLLVEMPKTWTGHFRLARETTVSFDRLVEQGDAAWASRQAAEEQRRLLGILLASLEGRIGDGSPQMAAALKWAAAARGVYDASVGMGKREALAVVVRTLGFPNAGGLEDH